MALSLGMRSCAGGLLLAAIGMPSGAGAQPTPVGPEFQVNTHTTYGQGIPSVAADADGGFVVVWGSLSSIQGQRYDSAGSPVGSQFQVNTYTTNTQFNAAVAADAASAFVVVWQSDGSSGGDTSSYSIQGQRYTTAAKVPSLSPAGLAAAALLMSLAVGIALRRRA